MIILEFKNIHYVFQCIFYHNIDFHLYIIKLFNSHEYKIFVSRIEINFTD